MDGSNMRAKKAMALLLTAAMTAGMLAGCGDTADTASGTKTESAAAADAQGTETDAATESQTSDLAGTQITLLNSKAEIQTALEEMAEVFTEDTGHEGDKRLQFRSGADHGNPGYHGRGGTRNRVCAGSF